MEELTKIVALVCGTAIVIVALILGYDSTLAFLAIIALFGGEKILRRLIK